jgi:exoribonuclease R
MNFYEDYINQNEDDIIGKLQCREGKWYYDDNSDEIENNRGMIDDMVAIRDCKVINIINRARTTFTGIIMFQKTYIFGKKKRSSYYLFKPLQFGVPDFYVASRNKYNVNKYVTITFDSWKTTERCPKGHIDIWIGNVGDLHSEREALLHHYGIYRRQRLVRNLINVDDIDIESVITNIYSNTASINNIIEAFSMDPKGCVDIDDALSCQQQSETEYLIGVHITDVMSRLLCDQNRILFKYISNNMTTVYAPHKRIDCLPEIWATNILSLHESRLNYVISVFFIFNNESNEIRFDRIEKNTIHITKNMSYDDSFDHNDMVRSLYDITEILYNLTNNCNNDIDTTVVDYATFDTHKMIEYWMVMANNNVGIMLSQHDIGQIPWRTHNMIEQPIENNLSQYSTIMKRLHSEAAQYTLSTEIDSIPKHDSMNLEYYVHFTSPIRRGMDMLIHLQIYRYILNEISEEEYDSVFEAYFTSNFVEQYNNYEIILKQLYHDYDFLDWIMDELFNMDNMVLNVEGIVMMISDNMLKIYAPDHMKFITYKCKLGDEKFNIGQHVNIELCLISTEIRLRNKLKIKIDSK